MDSRLISPRIELVRGDTGPQIKLTITDEATGAVADLTDGSAVLHFRAEDSTTLLFSRNLNIPSGTADEGIAYIQWGADDLDQTPGDYEGEVEVTFGSGLRQTVYDTLKFRIRDEFA